VSGAGLLDRVLAGWDVASVTQDLSTLDALHRAYLTRVPFENATKLVKASRTGTPDTALRWPVEFWEEHLRWGSGGTCFAATSAFQFLLRYLGFASTPVFCHLPAQEPDAHAALLVTVENRRVLVDVGYALPVPVPLPTDGAVRRVTDYYDVEVRPGPQEEYLVFSEDKRGQRFRYRFTLRPAPYMRRLALGRFANATRYLYKDPTRIFEITREGERSRPLEDPRISMLAGIFGLPEPLLEAALRCLERPAT
jgi:arylamine N-acetyltransferase